jgi:hypothetical protein
MNRLVWPGSIRQARLKIPIHFADDTVTFLVLHHMRGAARTQRRRDIARRARRFFDFQARGHARACRTM